MRHNWVEAVGPERADAIVQAMAWGGVGHLFFTSGSDILFFQEAIARAEALGAPAPRLISIAHESVNLAAALGYAAASGRPVATAVHVDLGTLGHGAGIHNAYRSGLPVLMTAGTGASGFTDSMRGARNSGHVWAQQVFDQNGIVRQYVKWDHRLEYQDNPGLMVSRALQVAQSLPSGPVYLSIPREIAMLETADQSFPTVGQLAVAPEPVAPDHVIDQVARALLDADDPVIVATRSGRDPRTVEPLVELCEFLGIRVVSAATHGYLNFPMDHPLYLGRSPVADADVVVTLDAAVPWLPTKAPAPEAAVFVFSDDPVTETIPTVEFEASLRCRAGALSTITALLRRVRELAAPESVARVPARSAAHAEASRSRRARLVDQAESEATSNPISVRYAAYRVAEFLAETGALHLDCTVTAPVWEYLRANRPGSIIRNFSTAGGWGSGAAFGAKLARPDETVVLTTGDGFFLYDVPEVAIMAARRYECPFLAIVFQNDSYNTGTSEVDVYYPDGYAARAGYEGGYLEPPVDFAMLAQAAGAWGRTVTEPTEIDEALRAGLAAVAEGRPAVVAIKCQKLGKRAAKADLALPADEPNDGIHGKKEAII